jgi:hypothetical protein
MPCELTKRAAPITALALCAGFPVPLLVDLCIAGLAIATSERMVAGRTARGGVAALIEQSADMFSATRAVAAGEAS